ncbi:MAG: putative DNA-binding domain-containing protein [Gammaproteobacteria bacterium]|nr:putative DNA-binding domain-containing protein [Gammaproteobacteria bacterium]
MASQPGFMKTQFAFASHIRNPQHNPRPSDVEARRMNIYSDLFFNNVEGFISNSFPVLRELHNDDSWMALVRDYFEHHRAKTPLFPEMPREFLYYLEHEREPQQSDYPFMLELAHYEWAELALSISDIESDLDVDTTGDLLNGVPVLSPLAWLLSYHWPVHQIGPDFIPEQASDHPNWLLVYRDNEDEVHFMELNPVTARLLQLIPENSQLTSATLLQQIAGELNHPNPQTVIQGGLSILDDLNRRNVILGIRL